MDLIKAVTELIAELDKEQGSGLISKKALEKMDHVRLILSTLDKPPR